MEKLVKSMMSQNAIEQVIAGQKCEELSPIELIKSASSEELFFYVMTNKLPKARLYEEIELFKRASSEEIVAYFGAK